MPSTCGPSSDTARQAAVWQAVDRGAGEDNNCGAALRRALVLGAALLLAVVAVRPALADCTQMGTIVLCTGNSPGGFTAGAGVDGLAVTVLPRAAVGTGITVNDNSTVANFGAVTVGNTATAVMSGSGGVLFNAGSLVAGIDGTGLWGGFGTTLVNTGSIVAGDGGRGMNGAGNMLNAGTIVVGTSAGIGDAAGMAGNLAGTAVVNTGTILGGTMAPGIIFTADNGLLANSGTITVGDDGYGLLGLGDGIRYVNSGVITVGEGGFGIASFGLNSIVNNSGTINVGACGTGIDTSAGTGASIRNSGQVIASGCSATAVAMGDGDTLLNSGTLRGPGSGFAVLGFGASNTVVNSGTIDGPIDLGGGDSTLVNAGLVTVSEALAPGGGVAHVIDGFFAQTASGTLALRVGPNPAPTNFDSLTVLGSGGGATGTANLGGRLHAVVQPGLYGDTTTYAGVLTFTVSTGRFATVDSSSVFLAASAVYNPTSVDLVLTRIPFNQFPNGGANARAVGNVLEANYSTSLTGPLAAFYTTLLQSTAPNTLSQLTGEVATAPQNASFAMFGQFLGTLFGQTASARALGGTSVGAAGGPAGGAPSATRMALGSGDACLAEACDTALPATRWSAWIQGFGSAASIDGNVAIGSSRVDMTTGGGATGIDARLENGLLLGATVGLASAGYSLTDLNSTGGATSVMLGFYGGYAAGPAYLDAALAYGFGTYTAQRFVGTGSFSEQINASFSGRQYGGRIEGGWRFGPDRHAVTPFAGLTVQSLQLPGYSEASRDTSTGAPGVLGLTVGAQTTTSVRSVLGAQVSTVLALDDDTAFRPRLRLGWAHEFNTDRSATVALGSLFPNAPFTVTGAEPAPDALVLSAGFDLEVGPVVRLYGQFDGDFSATARAISGTGGLRVVF
jgi:outer membrane autotransporter protein